MSAESAWDYDGLPDECPECGETVYLAARVTAWQEETPVEAEMMCGERFYRAADIQGIPAEGEDRGCGHTWDWERERIDEERDSA